jgi:uncharacterized protein YjbI with pentapeptide repeats
MEHKGELTPLESRLVVCAAAGDELDCAPTGATSAEFDQIDDWEERKIRAEVLIALCTGEVSDWSVHPRRGLRLRGAYIAGQVDLSRAQLTQCPLAFHTCRFEEGVVLYQATTSDISFTSCDLPLLHGNELNSGGSLDLRRTHLRKISLVRAEFRGLVGLSEVYLSNPKSRALNAERMSAAAVDLNNTHVEGAVRLLGANIGGQLACNVGTELLNPEGTAFNADGISASSVNLVGTHVEGETRFVGANIGVQLNCSGGTELINPGGHALLADSCQVGGSLIFSLGETSVGSVNLAYAQIGTLGDNLASWPDTYDLVGFTYNLLSGDKDPARRLTWISKSEPFSPHVYTQLAEVYRRSGHEGFARQVAVRREKERGQQPDLSRGSRAWNHFLGLTVAYGYQPWRALVPLVVLFVLGLFLFSRPAAQEVMVHPSTKNEAPISAAACHEPYPCFSPSIYVLDTLLPIVDLHQESNWVPARPRPWGVWYEVLTWVLIAFGWILTTAVVAGIGSLWRRE